MKARSFATSAIAPADLAALIEVPHAEPSTIASQWATPREHAVATTLVIVLLIASIAAYPFHGHAFPTLPAFIPAFAGTTGMADALTAALLFGLFRTDGTRAILAAATAYLIDALLMMPYALTFPNVITPTGFIGNEQSAAWLWLIWHIIFPLVIIFALLRSEAAVEPGARARTALRYGGAAVGFALVMASSATIGRDYLPLVVHHGAFSGTFRSITLFASMLNVACVIVLLRGVRPLSTLVLWLVVAVVASAIDTSLNAVSPGRYSAPWYLGKLETFVTASVVLVSLLSAWASLYARSAALTERLTSSSEQRRRLEERLAREQSIARALQQASLPRSLPNVDGIALHAIYRPAVRDIDIGGDWYDAFQLPDGRLVLTIGDVAGKGLPASLVMGKVRQSLRVAAQITSKPSEMLAIADRTLQNEFTGDLETIVTAFVGVLDDANRLVWSSAGHPPPIVRYADGRVAELYGPSVPLGLHVERRGTDFETTLSPGVLLIAFTDGLVEATHDVVLGTDALLERMRSYDAGLHPDPATYFHETTVGDGARDDVAILTMQILASRVAIERTTHETALLG